LALAVVPVGFLVGLMFGGLGMMVTARAPSYDFFSYYFTLGISVMFLFSGVFFPLESLPAWARSFAWLLPLTHAVNVCRALARGALPPSCAIAANAPSTSSRADARPQASASPPPRPRARPASGDLPPRQAELRRTAAGHGLPAGHVAAHDRELEARHPPLEDAAIDVRRQLLAPPR